MMSEWEMYAQKRKDVFWHLGVYQYTKAHGGSDPIVKVKVTPDENGEYWGYIITGEDKPIFIYPSIVLLKVCFAYGLEAAENSGDGKRIQLSVTEIP